MKSSNSRKIPKMKDHAILEVKQIIEDITEKWSSGIISNFSYLMILNTLSGRTYNDLSQYPVLPWVISDYASESINLSNTSVYRDLSYPIFLACVTNFCANRAILRIFLEDFYQIGQFYRSNV